MDVQKRQENRGFKGALLAFLGVAVTTANVRAGELAGAHLVVQRAENASDCPDESALTQATLALGTLPPTAPDPLELEVSFRREPSGYFAEVRASGRTEGVRQVSKEGSTCAPLAEAVSVVLAVLLDLEPRDVPTPPPLPPPTAPPAPAPARAPAAPMPTEPVEPAEPLGFALGAHVGAAYRLVGDGVAPTLSVAFRPRVDRWEAAVGALWAPYGSSDYLDHSIAISLLSGRLGGCAWLQRSRARADLGLCAGFSVGNLHARGKGFPTEESANDVWLAFDAGAAGRLPLTRKWAVRFTISTIFPTRAQTYTAAGTTEEVDHSPAAALVELGPELTFP